MSRDHTYFVYFQSNRKGGVIYTGVTNDLLRRAAQHRMGDGGQFTSKYKAKRLVWFETHSDINEAIMREKLLKRWHREWKITLIEKDNPHWRDLFDDIAG